MGTMTNNTEKFAAEAMDLHGRLYQTYLDECDKRDIYGHKAGDPRRIERLRRLSRMAADRWRRVMGYPPMYDGTRGTPR